MFSGMASSSRVGLRRTEPGSIVSGVVHHKTGREIANPRCGAILHRDASAVRAASCIIGWVTEYREDPAGTPPTVDGQPWMTCRLGPEGPHAVADLVLYGRGGQDNRLVCHCGETLSAAPYTVGYRYGSINPAGRADMMRQHQALAAELCVYCGKSGCWCHMTVGS
jgi:hypothetical protein